MNMQNQLQKLAAAAAAQEDSAARKHLLQLFDEGSFVEIDRFACDGDKPAEAVAGYGTVDGAPVYAFAQDHAICCGAIGKAQAAKIRKVYDLALLNGAPVVGVFDSDGAKLGEGIDAMDAIADILHIANTLSGVVPQIAVITGACVGSSALIAVNADVVVAVKDAAFHLNVGDEEAKASVTAADDREAMEAARAVLSLLPSNNLAVPDAYVCDTAAMPVCEDIAGIIEAVADPNSAVRLYEGEPCETVLARVGGNACGLLTLTGDKISGCAAARAARFIRLCDAFSLPVLTFVDAAGFESLKGAAKLSHAYAEATAAKLTVIVGRAYGPVYIAAAGKSAGADVVLAWPGAVITPLAPETAIHLLWKDKLSAMTDPTTQRAALAEEYAETACSPLQAAAMGAVTDVITPAETKAKLSAMMDMLSHKRQTGLPRKHSNMPL